MGTHGPHLFFSFLINYPSSKHASSPDESEEPAPASLLGSLAPTHLSFPSLLK